MPDQTQIDLCHLQLAIVNGFYMSKDPRTKVGAAILSSDGRQVSLGYNGLPVGYPDTPENWTAPLKYEIVVHAEMNAILNAPFDTAGATLYCALKPCHRCLMHAINARIKRVVWYASEHRPLRVTNESITDIALTLFDESHVYWDEPNIEAIMQYFDTAEREVGPLPER